MIEFYTWYEQAGKLLMVFPIQDKGGLQPRDRYHSFAIDEKGWKNRSIALNSDEYHMGTPAIYIPIKSNFAPSLNVKHNIVEYLLSVIP